MKSQIKLGLVLILFLFSAGIVIISLGNVTLKKGYEFDVLFDNIADLPNNSVIKISGVEVGRVRNISLDNGKARVRVWIEDEIDIYQNAQINITRSGIIGNTFMTIDSGTPEYPPVEEADLLYGGSPIGYEETLEDMINGIDRIVTSFETLTSDKDLIGNVNSSFENLSSLTKNLDQALGEEGKKLGKAVDNLGSILEQIDKFMIEQREEVKDNIQNIGRSVEDLNQLLLNTKEGRSAAGKLFVSEDYGQKVGQTIDSIFETSQDLQQAVDRAKGFNTRWETEFYYTPATENLRSSAGLSLIPGQNRYLFLGLDNITPPDSSKEIFDSGGDRVNSFTLKAGKKINNLTIYGGAIRSSGGVGVEWDPFKNRLRLGTEVFDLSRSENPWWKISSKLMLTEYLKLGVAGEDLLKEATFRAGLEIRVD